MELIIVIVFVALAMLASNIKAAKQQQQAAMREETSDDAEATSGDGDDALATLLRQLSGQKENRGTVADNNPDGGQAHEHNRKTDNDAEFRIDDRLTISAANGDTLPHRDNTISSAGETTSDNVDNAINPMGSSDDDIQTLREDFDLRNAVLYSEILKPKFDNCKD